MSDPIVTRQGNALLEQLRATAELAAAFAGGDGIRDVESEDAFLEPGASGFKAPALLVWYGGEEEERLPSGVAMLTTHWRATVLLPRIAGVGTNRFARCTVLQLVKAGFIGPENGVLRDGPGEVGRLSDRLVRWERVDALRPFAGERTVMRTVVGASFDFQIFETTREAG